MDYFLQKIVPALIGPALIAGFTLVIMYTRLQTLADQVHAQDLRNDQQDAELVRKDVLEPQLTVIKDNTLEMKQDIKDIRKAVLGR
jgi:hypothetical protein